VVLAIAAATLALPAAAAEGVNRPPAEKDWLALARLPDWSGVWTPDVTDQMDQISSNPAPWMLPVAKRIAHMAAEEKAGRPFPVLMGCLPHGMPALMMITHNAMEILFTPGRVTILGESDGDNLRRIYTDGRNHPDDPDLTFHGHSIGHWEGKTLVVDTVGILPQVWLAVSEAVGTPNDGDMHIVERIHLDGPDVLLDDLEITAPKVLTRPWKTTRRFYRQRSRRDDIVEGVCVQGDFKPATDDNGDAVYVPIVHGADGGLSPTGR
jgi:hypothetical protein